MEKEIFGDIELEIDEKYVTAGCKGKKKTECQPRRRGLRANQCRGIFEKDKSFIVTFVCRNTKKHTARESEIIVYTDEYKIHSKNKSHFFRFLQYLKNYQFSEFLAQFLNIPRY